MQVTEANLARLYKSTKCDAAKMYWRLLLCLLFKNAFEYKIRSRADNCASASQIGRIGH